VSFHVDYVTDEAPSPDPIGFVLDTLADPLTLVALGGGAIALAALLGAWAYVRPLEGARERFVRRAQSYVTYVPWMLRLSVGLVLIGAGLSRVLFVPTMPLGGPWSLGLTAIGFALLLGIGVRPVALIGLIAFVIGLVIHPRLIEMLDVAGGLVAAAIVGPGAPSLDDMLRAAFPAAPGRDAATGSPAQARYGDLVPLVVRIGLGGAFAASGIVDKLLIYERALAAVDQYGLTRVLPVPAEMWVLGAAVVETTLGVAIILGIMTRLGAILGFAVLTLALFALPDDPVVAHVGLFGLSSVLVVLGGGRYSVDALLGRHAGQRSSTGEALGT
jgi:uncharacterized membrane protein YphA (DoxX/SURF4 family)